LPGGRGSRHVGDGLPDQQAQPARIGIEPIGRQAQEHGAGRSFRSANRKSDAEVLSTRRGLSMKWVWRCAEESTPAPPVRLAELAIGGARDQAAGAGAGLHVGEQRGEAGGIAGELVAHGRQRDAGRGLVDDGVQDHAGDQRLGFLVPVRLTRLPRCVMDQCIGDRLRIFREVGLAGSSHARGAGRGASGDAERVQAPHIALGGPRTGRDAGVLALGVDADHRAVQREQVGDDRADTFP
jgi:hypothetical protein